MSDFISLNCPSCGRVLPVADSAHISEIASTIYTCDSCGVKSILKRDSSKSWLETYAACPKCNNNDKSIKISALAKLENQPKIDLTFPVEPRALRFVPREFAPNEFSYAAFNWNKFRIVPRVTQRDLKLDIENYGRMAAIVFGLCLFAACGLFADPNFQHALPIIAAALFGPLLLYVLLRMLYKTVLFTLDAEKQRNLEKKEAVEKEKYLSKQQKARTVFDLAEIERKNAFDQAERDRKDAFAQAEAERMKIENARYKKAEDRWKKMYYCGRDDVIFIFGTNEYEDSEKFQEFLYR